MKVYTTLIGIVCLALTLAMNATASVGGKAVDANNTFGFEFYRAVKRSQSEKHKNRLLSPVSAYMALAMTSNGARGETEEAIRKTIAASHMDRSELNAANLELLLALTSRRDVQLELANSVWTRQGLGLLASFSQNATKYYRAEARELDFSDPNAADIINGWASDKTHGRIKDVVEKPIEDDFYLINATYFKGSWSYPFAEESTKLEPFHGPTGKKAVPTMHNRLDTQYLKRSNYEVVALPYGERMEASLLLFVTENLDKLEESLDVSEWKAINTGLAASGSTYNVTLSLPKFQFEYDADLKIPLSEMGMAIAFSGAANFFDLTRAPMVLSKAIQKTFINLDEKGTEAAAVTVIGGITSVPFYPEVTVRVDRPFLVAIRDNSTGAVLFLGSILQP